MPNWFCVATVVGREKLAAQRLASSEAAREVFAPRILERRMYMGRPRRVPTESSLFAGYLFAYGEIDRLMGFVRRWRDQRQATGIHNLVGFSGEPSVVPSAAIEEIQAHVGEDGIFRLCPPEMIYPSIKKGTDVRIMEGPFAGFIGCFEQMTGRERSIVLINWLGRQCLIEVERAFIEPLALGYQLVM